MAVQVDKKVVFMGVGILVGVIGIAIASRWLYKKIDSAWTKIEGF